MTKNALIDPKIIFLQETDFLSKYQDFTNLGEKLHFV